MNMIVGFLLFSLHAILCVYTYIMMKKNRLNLPLYYIIFAVALPFVGSLFLYVVASSPETQSGEGLIDEDDIGDVKAAEIEENEEVLIDNSDDLNDIISLEEALLLEDSVTSRKLLLDIIGQNPEEFLDLFYLARLSNDTEVVHYATTVIAESSRQYDVQMMEMEKKYKKEPDNLNLLKDYCALIGDYLQINLVTDQAAVHTRGEYALLLEKLVSKDPSLEHYIALIENDLVLEKYDKVEKNLTLILKQWPRNEKVWLLLLKFYQQSKQGDKVKMLIQEIKEENIYISANNKDLVNFWL